MSLAGLILGLVTLQRLGELVLAKRNTDRLLAQGAREAAAGHYPLIVALHAAWLVGLWYLAVDRLGVGVSWGWLAVFPVVLQGLRVWVIATLVRAGRTPPHHRAARRALGGPSGPYRFVLYRNHDVVAAEILVLPLVFGLVWYGIVFSALNAVVLLDCIRAEEGALGR